MLAEKTKTTHQQSESHKPKKWFTDDDVVEAWKQGKEYYKQKVMKEFGENLKKAQSISEEIIESLFSQLKIKVKRVHLKNVGLHDFTSMFVIPESIFLDFEKYNSLSSISSSISSKYNNKGEFNISFLFMPNGRSFNKEAVVADGFTYTYVNG